MANKLPRRGLLVVIEGLDKAGKSTQCTKLVKNLQSRDITVKGMRFPDRTTPIGRLIDQYLRGQTQVDDHVIHLLFSANRWEASAQIKQDISSGTTLVIDRYHYSGCVYSAAKNIPGLDLEWASWPEVGLPRPDICIFLDVSAADAQARGGFGEEKYEQSEMQDRVRGLFEEMRRADPDRFRVIDAGRRMGDVEYDILDVVLKEMERLKNAGEAVSEIQTVRPMCPHP